MFRNGLTISARTERGCFRRLSQPDTLAKPEQAASEGSKLFWQREDIKVPDARHIVLGKFAPEQRALLH